MAISFPYKKEKSSQFGITHRPVAEVYFKHKKEETWRHITMLIDTGADYTLLPHFLALPLGINLVKDCRLISTQGVGGKSKVYLLKGEIRVKVGDFERKIPLGFLANDFIPPLLGRQGFFETFKVTFEKFIVTFE